MTPARAALLVVALSALAGGAAAQAAGPALIQIEPTAVDPGGARLLRSSNTILVPTLLLNVAVDGSLYDVKRKRGAVAGFKVEGLQKAWLQDLARQIHDDFVKRLVEQGYIVLTYKDVKDHADISRLGRQEYEVGRARNLKTDRFAAANYLIVTPSDAQSFRGAVSAPSWPFRGVAHDLQAAVIIPEFWINAPQVWAKAGGKSASSVVNLAGGLDLLGAFYWVLNQNGNAGAIKLRGSLNGVADATGEILLASDDAGGKPDPRREPGVYRFLVDPPSYGAAVLKAAMSVNKVAAEAAGHRREK